MKISKTELTEKQVIEYFKDYVKLVTNHLNREASNDFSDIRQKYFAYLKDPKECSLAMFKLHEYFVDMVLINEKKYICNALEYIKTQYFNTDSFQDEVNEFLAWLESLCNGTKEMIKRTTTTDTFLCGLSKHDPEELYTQIRLHSLNDRVEDIEEDLYDE